MSSPKPSSRAWLLMISVIAAGPILYVAGLWAASTIDRRPAGQIAWLDPAATGQFAAPRLAAAAAMAVGATLLLFAVPWLLGFCAVRKRRDSRCAVAWSLALNSAALVLVCLLLRHSVGIHRGSLLVAWMAWTVLLLWPAGGVGAASAEIRSLCRKWNVGLLIGLLAVGTGIALFAREQVLQCFNGDGTEIFELARSLRHHFIPYWEIDVTESFGTVIAHPAVVDSYWTLGVQVLLGEVEFSSRLSYWVWWLGVFFVALGMAGPRGARPDWRKAIVLASAVLLASVWYTFYTGYYPYMTDLACPGVPDAMLILLFVLALDCLRREDLAGWVLMIVLMSVTSYAGPVVFVLTAVAAVAWQPIPRRRMIKAALAAAASVSGVVLCYVAWGWSNGLLSAWWGTLTCESFEGYFAPIRPTASAPWFVVYFLLGCGVLPVLGLILPFRRVGAGDDRALLAWQRTVATVAFGYLLIILGVRCRNIHYLGPLLMVPPILWLQTCRSAIVGVRSAKKTLVRGANNDYWLVPATVACYLFCLAACWPISRPVFMLNRQFGAATTFQTDSYEEAVRWSKIIHPLYHRGLMSWQAGPHTWVGHAELSAAADSRRPLLVTDGPPPEPEYELLFESDQGVKIYCRDPHWAARLNGHDPPAGRERFPWILRAAAIEPSAQENVLQGEKP